MNEVLDANEFQRNTAGLPRPPDKWAQPGISAGGPLHGSNLFASGTFEFERFRGAGDPELTRLPTRNFVPASDFAKNLLAGFDAPAGPGQTTQVYLTPPFSINRYFVMPRADYLIHQGSSRLFARAAIVRLTRPDFIWTPYRAFSSPLRQNVTSGMGGWLGSRGGWTNELRAGWTLADLRFDRAQPEVPQLQSFDQTLLPGGPARFLRFSQSRSQCGSGGERGVDRRPPRGKSRSRASAPLHRWIPLCQSGRILCLR